MPDGASVAPKSSIAFSCLPHLLEYQAERIPDAPAILAPGRAALSYSRLHRHIEETGCALRAMGIARHDRVAVVLPNGPEMAVAILTVAANAACAPMNPAYGAEELDRYFADLRPSALITPAGVDSPACHVARARGIRVLELSAALDAAAGLFTLSGERDAVRPHEAVNPGDPAVLLFTSGTTSRPKIVPLTHANICTSACSSGAALALSETDRCLNVLPLFHGHGLFATVLASLAAGASVVCTPGCDVNSFFAWVSAFRPTWYSAVPTMHQAIVAHARHNREQAADCRLRFIRSASAPLPPRIFAELERIFDTCVIEFYGMTETASSPIACNPLPPRPRKAGSVGVPVGLDVAIMDDREEVALAGRTGQVVVRGASVMPGYDGDRLATHAVFAGDWFKTGDHGYFDEDGYLFLVGRKEEIVNRGGEKVAPREVDEVLLDHPAVAEAVTFAVPHATLGEDVAAAIVLRPGATSTPKDIRQFAIGRIADFKVPRQVFIVTDIPKSSTGKVQRVGLAARLGFASEAATPPTFAAPRTPLEQALAGFWAEILEIERIGIHDDFFAMGGDSLLATQVLAHAEKLTNVALDISRFFEAPTVAETARHLESAIRAGATSRAWSAIVRASREGGVPASIAQEQLWQLQQALPGLPYFNILYALRLTSPLEVAALERSINEIVRRHEILRTTFAVVDGRPMQVVAPQLTVPLIFDDLRALSASKRDRAGQQVVQAEVLHRFDLGRGPLFRARLLRLAAREHFLLISTHQAICDGWSLGVFVEELAALYEAFAARKPSPLAPLAIQYADFASWQQSWRSQPDIAAQLAYWREQLRGPLPVTQFAPARPRRTVDALHTARRGWALPANLSHAAKRFSHREGATLFMVLLATLKTLLHRSLGQEDLRVATLVANRNRPGTERLIGPLANTVILRTNLGGDPSSQEVMRRVRATTLAAFAHQDLPFEEVVETLERERDLKPAALSQIMILLQNAALRPITGSGHALAFEEADPSMLLPLVTTTTFDVVLMLHESAHGLTGSCVYRPQLFRPTAIARLLGDFQNVLEWMVTHPDRPISAIRVSSSRRDRK